MKEKLYDRYLNDDLSEEEKESFINYIEEENLSEDFAQYIVDTASIVGLSEKILSQKTKQTNKKRRAKPKKKQKKKSSVFFWFSAVAALIAISFIVLTKLNSDPSSLHLQSSDPLSYILRNGEKVNTRELQNGDLIFSAETAIIRDKDGSIIELSANSSLKIISSGKHKIFKLNEGLIKCKVTPQKGDFQINSKFFKTTVIGTEFTIVASSKEGRILVDSGKVKCNTGETSKTLEKKDLLIVDKERISLGLEEILTSRKWEMEWIRLDESIGKRQLSFNKKGSISLGVNEDESFWEIINNELRILSKNRQLRFKVKYDFTNGEWLQVGKTQHGYIYKLKK